MRQDVHPSIRRPSVLQFFLSLPPRLLARRPRENLFRSSHSLCGGGGHFLCANYFPFGITSRPLPLFQSLPTGRRTDIPPRWNCFSRPSSRSMRARRSIGHLPRGNTCTCRPRPIAHPKTEGSSAEEEKRKR